METPHFRRRRDDDDERIAFVVRRAFGGEAEVGLAADLRAEGVMVCEFVAEHKTEGLIGYVGFSRLGARSGERRIEAVALAPLAVLPTQQRHRVGTALVEYSLVRLKEMKVEIAVVLGDPAFYSRFGFSALLARLLHGPYSGQAFQALELTRGALGKGSWDLAYPTAFAKLT